MMRKLSALLLVVAMLMALFTGCGKKNEEAIHFYTIADELLTLEDVSLEATLPYHGISLTVSGGFAPGQRRADLTFSFSGTEQSDGLYTELRADGTQSWLNVRQLAEQTLRFELYDYFRSDIEMFYEEQFADWLIYEMDETFWQGIPGWKETILQIWEETKGDIEPYLSGSEDEAVLTLTAGQMKSLIGKVGERVLKQSDTLQQGFVTFAEQEQQFMNATQLTASDLAESVAVEAEEWLAGVANGSHEVSGGTLRLTREDAGFDVELKLDDGRIWSLQIAPAGELKVERPYSVMEFAAYGEEAYYLATLSNDYLTAMLTGIEQDDQLQQLYEAEQEMSYTLDEMTTGTIAGYDDLLSIQFISEGGLPMTLPILRNFLGNSVEEAWENSVELLYADLISDHWEQEILTEYYEGKTPDFFLEDKLQGHYDAYINTSGFLLVQDLSELQHSENGRAITQGFAYREDDYSDTHAIIMIVLPQEGLDRCAFMQLDLFPTLMSEGDRLAVIHLFEYLGLDCPVDLGL